MISDSDRAGLIFDRYKIPFCTFSQDGTILSRNACFAEIEKSYDIESNLFNLFADSRRIHASQQSCLVADLKTKENRSGLQSEYRVIVNSGSAILFNITEYLILEKMTWDALEKASLANAVYSRFFSGIHHEIRTPLNSIIGLTELLLESSPERSQSAKLRKIRLASYQLLHAVEDLLEISELNQTHRTIFEECTFSLDELLTDVLSVIFAGIDLSVTEFRLLRDPEISDRLQGPEEAVKRILRIIAGNAVKYTPSGSVSVRVFKEEGFLRISVKDTGPGLPAEILNELFNNTKSPSRYQGRYRQGGLSLSLAKQFAENAGGSISVSSEPGKGTDFLISIPVTALPSDSEDTAFLREEKPAVQIFCKDSETLNYIGQCCDHAGIRWKETEKPEISGNPDLIVFINPDDLLEETIKELIKSSVPVIVWFTSPYADEIYPGNQFNGFILPKEFYGVIKSFLLKEYINSLPEFSDAKALITEDNAVNQEVLRGILERRGIRTICTETGEGTLRLLEDSDGTFDILFMDIQLPGMDGTETVRAIRRSGLKSAGIPVIALTANVSEDDRIRCIAAGVDIFLKKPVNPRKVLEAAAALIPHKRIGRSSGTEFQQKKIIIKNQKINLEEGLARALGDTELFSSILNQFTVTFADFADVIKKAVNDNDLQKAIRHAHSLKGVAANLGLHEIREWARHLEEVIKGNSEGNYIIIADKIEEMLSESFVFIRQWIQNSRVDENRSRNTDAGTVKEFYEKIKKIYTFARENDVEAVSVYNELDPKSVPAEVISEWKKLGDALSRYNFYHAVTLAEKLTIAAEHRLE